MKVLLALLVVCFTVDLSLAGLGVRHPASKKAVTGSCPLYPTPVPFSFSNPLLVSTLQSIDYYLQQQREVVDLPALMAVIVYDQDIVWHNEYGHIDPLNNNSAPPTFDSVVQIASITKVFTDLMMFQMRDRGIVNLDDYVDKYMTGFSMKDPYTSQRRPTLRQIASHTGGLPREVPCNWMDLPMCSEADILDNLTKMAYISPPYTTPHYSNLGISLLGRALEKVAKMSYEDYVDNNLLQPLGMNSSGFDYQRIGPQILKAVTYLINGSRVPAPIETLAWGNPMGGMLASPRDMAKFMSFLFRSENFDDSSQILDYFTVREVLSPIILTADGSSAFGTPWEQEYDTVNQVWLRSKAGQLLGYRSQVTVIPEIKLGIFITTTNGAADDATKTIFTQPILDMLIPVITEILNSVQPSPPLPPNPESYTGTYLLQDTMYNTLNYQVYFQDNVLYGSYVLGNYTYDTDVILAYVSPNIFRASLVANTVTCRWRDDGTDGELIYFNYQNGAPNPDSIVLMGQVFSFISKKCLNCEYQ